MSMNIHINAKGKPSIKFPCEQTPTDETYQIMNSHDRIGAYRKYWQYKRFNYRHVDELDQWLKYITELGLTAEVWVA